MKELSLNVLDISKNSVRADAKNIEISIFETDDILDITIKDDGFGMDEETLLRVTDPFCTTRKTRKVGLGIPFYKLAAEQTGGSVEIISKKRKDNIEGGTIVKATFFKNHIDFTPLGDIVSTVCTLIQGSPEIDFLFTHKIDVGEVRLDTKELKSVLQNVPLDSPDVIFWIREYLSEQYNELYKK